MEPPPFGARCGAFIRSDWPSDPVLRQLASGFWTLKAVFLADRPDVFHGYQRLNKRFRASSGIFVPMAGGACKTVAMDAGPAVQPRSDAADLGPDRKSTRLNSSH